MSRIDKGTKTMAMERESIVGQVTRGVVGSWRRLRRSSRGGLAIDKADNHASKDVACAAQNEDTHYSIAGVKMPINSDNPERW